MGSDHEVDGDNAVQNLLDRLMAGDPEAPEEILTRVMARFRRLAGKMLARNPDLRRWEDTDDLLQNAAVRLHRALRSERPRTPQELFGLAALQVRRELVDLARHHFGPEGGAKHHASDPGPHDGSRPPLHDAEGEVTGPSTLLRWQEFHEQVQSLPEPERQVFDLAFYHGLPQREIARILETSEKTVKRRWRSAREFLGKALGAFSPLE